MRRVTAWHHRRAGAWETMTPRNFWNTRAFTPTGGPTGKTWSLVFIDNFNGTTLDTTRWIAEENRSMNNVINKAAQVSVSGGNLVLQLSADGLNGGDVSSDPLDGAGVNGYTFEVGDYVEALVYAPGSTTTSEQFYNWPAFWATGRNWPSNGENDIWEGLGGDPTINYHYGPTPASEVVNNSAPRPGTWGNGWHVYAAYRRPNQTDVYWDGVLNRTYHTNDLGGGQAVMVNIGESGSRTVHTGSSGAILVDYVRAWRAPVSDPILPNWPLTFTATTASDTSADCTWSAATNTKNGTTITGYRVYDQTTNSLVGTFGNVTSGTVTGLSPGTPYVLGVKAVNSAGESIQTSPTSTITTTFTVFPLPGGTIVRNTSIPTTESASATSITVARPTGTVTGDVLVATFAGDPIDPPTISGGWTLMANVNQSVAIAVWTRRVTNISTEPTSYTITGNAVAARMSAMIAGYSNVNPYVVADVAATSAFKNNNQGSTLTIPSLTTVSKQAVLFAACAGGFSTGNYIMDPPEMKRMFQAAGGGRRISVADEYRASAGATGTRSFTESASALLELDGIMFALRPAAPALGGAITRKLTTTAETASATGLACNVPSGIANNDVLVAAVSFSGGTLTTPTGWTLMRAQGTGSGSIVVGLFRRTVTNAGTEPASYTFAGTGAAASRISVQITAYSGVNTTTPEDVAAVGTTTAVSTTSTTTATIVPVTAGAVLVGVGGTASASAVTIIPDTANMNEIWHSTGTGRQMTFEDEYRATVGTVSRTWTQSGLSTLESQVALGALRPA